MRLVQSEEHRIQLTLPVGASLELRSRFLDEYSREFDKVSSEVQYTSNSQDIISIQANKLRETAIIYGNRPGDVIIRATYQQIDDYVRIRIENSIIPSSPIVHVGGKVIFSVQYEDLLNKYTENEKENKINWASTVPSVFSMADKRQGEGRANKVGSSIIKRTDLSSTSTHVHVVEINNIQINADDVKLNNYNQNQVFYLPIQFYSGEFLLNISSENPNHQLSFDCFTENDVWSIASPEFQSGEPVCSIKLLKPSLSTILKNKYPDYIDLHIKIYNNQGFSHSVRESIRFYPDFIIDNDSKSLLISSSKSTPTQFSIKHGSNEPVLSPSNLNLFSIRKVSKHLDTSTYEINVFDRKISFVEKIKVSSPFTPQVEYIDLTHNANSYVPADPTDFIVFPSKDSGSGPSGGDGDNHEYTYSTPGHSSKGSLIYFISLSLVTLLSLILGYLYCYPTATVTGIGSPAINQQPGSGPQRPAPNRLPRGPSGSNVNLSDQYPPSPGGLNGTPFSPQGTNRPITTDRLFAQPRPIPF